MWAATEATSGGTPAKETLHYWDGGIPWVSPKDMKRRIIDSSEDTISEVAIAETRLKLIPNPAVLIVVRGMILAHSFPVAITAVPVTINQDMKALRLRKELNPYFLGWWLEGAGRDLLAVLVDEAAHGTKAIRMDKWRVTMVEIPPLPEQHAIATFLDRETAAIDALVAKKERLIELLQEKRTALITRGVTKGLDSNIPMKDSGIEWLGEIPAHWEVIRLKYLVIEPLKYGANEAAELTDLGLPRYIRITDIRADGSLREETFRSISEEAAAPYLLSEGDLLFARSGATVGKTFRYTSIAGRAAYAGYLIRARLDQTQADSRFVLYFTQSGVYWKWLQRSCIQATIQNVGADRYANLMICLPPHEEQEEIIQRLYGEVAQHEYLIAKVREAIDRLKELRTALISAAVTGKIDVREEVEIA